MDEEKFETKKCDKCKKIKDIDDFHKNKNRKDGLASQCKLCRKDIDKEQKREYDKKYRLENKEKIKEQDRIRRKNKKEEISEYNKKQYKEKRRKLLEHKKKYYKYLVEFNSPYTNSIKKYGYEIKNNNGLLEVRCKYEECKKMFTPTNRQIHNRLSAINGNERSPGAENHLYCSYNCKKSCDIFRKTVKQLIKQDEIRAGIKQSNIKQNSNNPEWVKMVLEQANYQCEICGSIENLNAHHEIPVSKNPLLAEDLITGWCLCKDCHYKIVHKLPGCSLSYLRKISCRKGKIE
jgi:hypothetical protein